MKKSLRSLFLALIAGATFLPLAGRAAGPTVETRLARLDQLLALTPAQKTQAAEVFRLEDSELVTAGSLEDRVMKNMEARQASRARIRALLSPAQQKVYDRAPQMKGGGLTLPSPETKLAQLDREVGLSAAQKKVALEVFQEEFEALVALPQSERPEKGASYRQAARDQVRALLTPDQLSKMDSNRQALIDQAAAERKAIEDAVRAAPGIVARVGSVVGMSMTAATAIMNSKTGLQSGTASYRIVGSTRTENLTVNWEKDATSQVRLVRIATAGGELLPL
jgi:hypothetical protein